MGKKVRIGPSFISAIKDVLGGSNGYIGKLGDEEAAMLWFDGKGVTHLKRVVQELLKIPVVTQLSYPHIFYLHGHYYLA